MAKRGQGIDAKGRSKPSAKHVRHYGWELDSEAYRHLSVYARCLLTELKSIYNGSNNGDLFLSVRGGASRLKAGVMTACRAFHDLEQHGFIMPRQHGNFHWKQRHATCWVLTEYEFGGAPPTKQFMKWRAIKSPGKQNTVFPEGQLVAPEGQTKGSRQQKSTICRARGTDNAKTSRNLSRTRYTDSLPGGGGSLARSGWQYPEPHVTNGVVCTYGVLFDRDYIVAAVPGRAAA